MGTTGIASPMVILSIQFDEGSASCISGNKAHLCFLHWGEYFFYHAYHKYTNKPVEPGLDSDFKGSY